MSKDFFKFRESLLNEDIRKMSHSRLKFHATKNVPHGSYSRSEIEDEHERRKRTDGAEYAKAKATMNEEVELDEKAYVSSLSPELGRKGSHDVIGKDGKVVKSYPYTKQGMKLAQKHLSKMKEEVDLDEAAPKLKGDWLKKERERNREHDAAMGRTPTGRKKPVRQMTSTQKSLAKMRGEEVELDEGLGHISAIQNMMAKEREAQAKKKYTAPTQAEIDADRKKDQRGKSRPSMSAKSITRKTYGNMMGGLKNEQVEQLDELSPNKLHAYIKGASKDLAKRSRMSGYDDKRGNYADGDKNRKRANKRIAGITGASGRLADKANMSEEYVNEKLKVSHGMGAWVDDFKKSDAPQFKGKSDKERRDMAVAAYLSAKRGQKEEYASDAQRKAVWASRAEKGKK